MESIFWTIPYKCICFSSSGKPSVDGGGFEKIRPWNLQNTRNDDKQPVEITIVTSSMGEPGGEWGREKGEGGGRGGCRCSKVNVVVVVVVWDSPTLTTLSIAWVFLITCSGKRTVSPDHFEKKQKLVIEKVLKEERTHAFATTIDYINTYWKSCKHCTWYKSDDTIVSEVRFLASIHWMLLISIHRIYFLAGRV